MPAPASLARLTRGLIYLLLTCLMTTSLVACADDRVVFHGFSYDVAVDSPGIDLLACRYGDNLGIATVQQFERLGKSVDDYVCGNFAGKVRVEDFLYVKWRDKATQQVYEDRVDLKSRLPSPDKMRGTDVYFLIDENKLYVYLIPDWDHDTKRNHLPEGKTANGPSSSAFLDVKTLYPDNDPPKVRGGRK